MYPISNDVLAQFRADTPQLARLTIGEQVITEENITQGGMSINRYCSSTDMLEMGSTVSAELNLILNNINGDLSDLALAGKEIYVEVGVMVNDTPVYVPMGYFTVDGAPRKLTKINVAALDRMMKFEKKIDPNAVTFPYTCSELLTQICFLCGVELGIDPDELTNYDYSITKLPDTVQTYRDLLGEVAEICGVCAFIDWQGKLILKWFEETATTITAADRYSSDLYEDAVEYTGLQILDGEEIYISGEIGYIMTVSDNTLIQHDHQTLADSLGEQIIGFTYTPFSANVYPMPHVYPLDMITFVDKDGNDVPTIITDWTFKLNGNTALKGRGKTAEQMGYGRDYSYTKSEVSLIQQLADTDKDEMGFYESRNPSEITILNGSRKQIAYMKMASTNTTRIQIDININLETVDTDSNDITKAICTYFVNADEITAIYPTETYIDGKHVLHLMYILALTEYEIAYFRLYMTAKSGNIIIPAKGIWFYASGLGIVGDGKWDGEFELFDDSTPIGLRDIEFEDEITESVVISFPNAVSISKSDNVTDISVTPITVANANDRMRNVIYQDAYIRCTEDGDVRCLEIEDPNAEVDIRTTEEEN